MNVIPTFKTMLVITNISLSTDTWEKIGKVSDFYHFYSVWLKLPWSVLVNNKSPTERRRLQWPKATAKNIFALKSDVSACIYFFYFNPRAVH